MPRPRVVGAVRTCEDKALATARDAGMKPFRLAGSGRAAEALSGEYLLVGVQRGSGRGGEALLATEGEWGLAFAGSAAIDMPEPDLRRFWRAVERLHCDYPHLEVDAPAAQWLKPELRIRVGGSAD